jgi:hypothetical protein
LWLTIRSFDDSLGRARDRVRLSPFIAEVIAFFAGVIAVVCGAGAILIWDHGVVQNSFRSDEVMVPNGGVLLVTLAMLVLLLAAGLATPLHGPPTRATVLATWWRTFRLALLLALGPGLVAFAMATTHSIDLGMLAPPSLPHFGPSTLGYRLLTVALVVATLLAHGAAASSLGVALGATIKRRGQAIALSLYLLVPAALVWSYLSGFAGPARHALGLPVMSLVAAAGVLMTHLFTREPQFPELLAWATFWVLLTTFLTIALLWLTARILDHRSSHIPAN